MAAMDQTKLQTAAGSGLAAAASGGHPVTPAPLSDSTAWKKQRPGATFFEKLQVSSRNLLLCIHHVSATCLPLAMKLRAVL